MSPAITQHGLPGIEIMTVSRELKKRSMCLKDGERYIPKIVAEFGIWTSKQFASVKSGSLTVGLRLFLTYMTTPPDWLIYLVVAKERKPSILPITEP